MVSAALTVLCSTVDACNIFDACKRCANSGFGCISKEKYDSIHEATRAFPLTARVKMREPSVLASCIEIYYSLHIHILQDIFHIYTFTISSHLQNLQLFLTTFLKKRSFLLPHERSFVFMKKKFEIVMSGHSKWGESLKKWLRKKCPDVCVCMLKLWKIQASLSQESLVDRAKISCAPKVGATFSYISFSGILWRLKFFF